MKSIKYFDINFENCEVFRVHHSFVEEFEAKNYSPYIHRIASNAICKFNQWKDIYIQISSRADISMLSFGGEPLKFFDRVLAYPDITSIILTYEDGSKEDIFPLWVDVDLSESNNCLQTAKMSEAGSLCIYIGVNYSDYEHKFTEADDKEYIDFLNEMIEEDDVDAYCE